MPKLQHDENMMIAKSIDKPDVCFYNIDDAPFRIYGVWREEERYCRIPKSVAKTISKGISDSYGTCAGGRIRFVTDSPYVAISVEYGDFELSSVITHLATAGFDVYADGKYAGAFRPPVDFNGDNLVSVVNLGVQKQRVITINMPLYTEVKNMHVGVAKDSALMRAPDYKYEKPVVFYGSSITNGAGASRPGTTYEARLSRTLDVNYHCLGFGGLAKGEQAFAEYIAERDMSVFVYDYDHNAKTLEYLEQTHERFFKIIRARNPELPIIIISKPDLKPECEERFGIIKNTYENALRNGDKKVWLIKGTDFFGDNELDFTVDGTHPSDLGYYFMAQKIAPVLKKALELS